MQEISNIHHDGEEGNASNQAWKAVFAPLSERRRLLGTASFLRTHIPLILESELGQALEGELVQRLLQEANLPSGNRVWFVSGGPGAGKSELLEWLSLSIAQRAPHRYPSLLHIHQYEADIVKIAIRLRNMLPGGVPAQEEQQLRWNGVRKKPRTIAKILVLMALDQLLESDDESYGLYYALANPVDAELRRFLKTIEDGPTMGAFELFSVVEWEMFQEQTSQPVPFSYEAFHQALQAAFHSYLLSGLSLPTLMGSVSEVQHKNNIRPILLIDDLVSSLHLFAPDLISMLMTSPGTWDVVCCVTPQNENRRVTDLFDRLANYPGMQGHYRIAPLDERQCINLARSYLLEYRRLQNCSGEGLSPFNEEALVRLLHGLPGHRRTPRAFLQHLNVVLGQEGDAFLTQLSHLASREYAVLIEDTRLACIGELYGPRLGNTKATSIHLAPKVFFGFPLQEIVLPIQPFVDQDGMPDEVQEELFHWLGKREETNSVALAQLRKGAARLLQEALSIGLLGVPEGASASFLHWRKAYKGVSPPILLAGEWRKSDTEGILLDWSVSTLAFDLAQYGTASGSTRRQLARYLRNAPQLATFFEAARRYQQSRQQELERQIAMPIDQFALIMAFWATLFDGQLTSHSLLQTGQRLHLIERLRPQQGQPVPGCVREWRHFFHDVFSLPQGKLNEERLSLLCSGLERPTLLNVLAVEATNIGKEFLWRGRLFRSVLQEWQQALSSLKEGI